MGKRNQGCRARANARLIALKEKAANAALIPPLGVVDEARATIPPADLARLVREAVEEYCNRHFAELARSIITTELRRLADDRARHLVDT